MALPGWRASLEGAGLCVVSAGDGEGPWGSQALVLTGSQSSGSGRCHQYPCCTGWTVLLIGSHHHLPMTPSVPCLNPQDELGDWWQEPQGAPGAADTTAPFHCDSCHPESLSPVVQAPDPLQRNHALATHLSPSPPCTTPFSYSIFHHELRGDPSSSSSTYLFLTSLAPISHAQSNPILANDPSRTTPGTPACCDPRLSLLGSHLL